MELFSNTSLIDNDFFSTKNQNKFKNEIVIYIDEEEQIVTCAVDADVSNLKEINNYSLKNEKVTLNNKEYPMIECNNFKVNPRDDTNVINESYKQIKYLLNHFNKINSINKIFSIVTNYYGYLNAYTGDINTFLEELDTNDSNYQKINQNVVSDPNQSNVSDTELGSNIVRNLNEIR